MKKIYILLAFFFCLICVYIHRETTLYHQILKINSPNEIFIDFNNNFILDEKMPFYLQNIYFISEKSKLDNYPILKDLSDEEKFFINYYTNKLVHKTLKNKFVIVKDNDIYIDGESYTKILLDSNLVFNNSIESQKALYSKIKSINLDEYVIYNISTKKYHKLSCNTGRNSRNFKILKKSELNPLAKPCKNCSLQSLIVEGNKPSDLKSLSGNEYSNIKDFFEKDNIKIYFLDLNKIFKPDSSCETKACLALKDEINSSEHSIDFAIYGIYKQPEIFNALVNAANRGVKIRWVLDYDKQSENYYPDSIKLKKFLPDVVTDEKYEKTYSPAIMHNKFFIFDNKKVWTGSSNITNTDLTGFNANYSVLINSSELAKIYEAEFNQMFNGKFHKLKKHSEQKIIDITSEIKIQPLFSPQDEIITKHIIPLITNAKKYIYIPIFFLTHKDLINALQIARNKGVEIKIINDATNANTKYSIHKKLRNMGIKVKTENYAGKMHMKTLIIDDEISVLGSMNFTKAAENKNDENVIIIYNKEISTYLKETFLYLWNKIPEKYEEFDPKAESIESIGSCFDGIDNDFDKKIDKDDEGCFYQNYQKHYRTSPIK